MAGDNKLMLELFLIGLLAFLMYAAYYFIAKKRKANKQVQARYKAYKTARRATATDYAAELQKAYLMTIYINRR